MTDKPTFTTTTWLAQVLPLEPNFYEPPVVYEFSENKDFRKNDKDWYDKLSRGE